MAVWPGATRSDEELERLLLNAKNLKNARYRPPRANERFTLENVPGELTCGAEKILCQLIDISQTGCRVRAEKRFRHGALASIEISFSLFGIGLRLSGETQWAKEDHLVGIRFNPLDAGAKAHMAELIARLREQRTDQEDAASLAAAAMLAQNPPAAPNQVFDLAYDKEIHCGEGRIVFNEKDAWRIDLHSPTGGVRHPSVLLDLSLRGLTVRTVKRFSGEVQDYIEAEFELRGLHFLLCGTVLAIYNPQTIGLRFNPMSRRKMEELAQALDELGGPSAQ